MTDHRRNIEASESAPSEPTPETVHEAGLTESPPGRDSGALDEHVLEDLDQLVAETSDVIDAEIAALLDDVAAQDDLDPLPSSEDAFEASGPPDSAALGGARDDMAASGFGGDDAGRRGADTVPETAPDETSLGAELLSDLERTLTDDVMDLLETEPSAVESILDSIFDEKAIFVQDEPPDESPQDSQVTDRPAAADVDVAGPRSPGATASVGDSTSAETANPASQPAETEGRESAPPGMEQSASAPAAPVDSADELAGDLEAVTERVGGEVDREISDREVQGPPRQEAEKSGPSDEPPHGTVPEPDETPAAADADVPADAAEVGASGDSRSSGRLAVIAALELASLPLQMTPEDKRHYVDLLALTLVFWVPVVWILALFVVG